jgi:hypothetical protein
MADWDLSIVKRRENSSGPAHARLAITYNVLPSFGQVTKGVRHWVGRNSYWQANS